MTTNLRLVVFGFYLFFTLNSISCIAQNTPPAPSNFRVTDISCGKVTFAWDDYADDFTIDSYQIYRSDNGPNGNYYHSQIIYSSTNNKILSYEYNMSNENTGDFYFKIVARINGVYSLSSAPLLVTYTCTGPSNLQNQNITCGNVTLSWTPVNDGLVSYYQIFRATTETGSYTQIGQVASNSTLYTDNFSNTYPTAVAGQVYYYKIRAIKNNAFTNFSNIINVSFQCPEITGFKVASATCGKVNLVWDTYTQGTVDILKSESPADKYYNPYFHIQNSNSAEDNSFLNFTNSKLYYYKIRGKIGNVYTEYQTPISASFTCPQTPTLRVNASTCGKVELDWDYYPASFVNTQFILLRQESPTYKYSYQHFIDANNHSFIDTEFYGTAQNNKYYYKLAGVVGNTITEYGNVVEATTTCDKTAPTGVTASSPECSIINIAWQPIQNPELTGYEIRIGDSLNGPFYPFAKVAKNQNSYTYTASNYYSISTSKYYVVSALYSNINSEFSAPVSTVSPCLVPTGLKVSNVNCGEVTLTWDNFPPGTNYTGYSIYYSQNGQGYYLAGSVGKDVTSFTHNENNHDFYKLNGHIYKIAGQFNNYHSELSSEVNVNFTCSNVQNFRVTQNNCDGLMLAWDNLSNDASYSLFQAETINGYYYNLTYSSNQTSYLLTHRLEAGKTYYFKIVAYKGSIALDPIIITATYNCNGPENLQIVSAECSKIKLSWDSFPTIQNQKALIVYRSINGGPFSPISGGIYTNEFVDTEYLQANKSLKYKVRAFFGSWNESYALRNSYFGNEVSTTITCAAPTGLKISSTKCKNIVLTYDPYPTNNGRLTYTLYRSDTGVNGDYKKIAENYSSTTYDDHNLKEAGKLYYYKIQAKIDQNNLYSEISEPLEASFSCESPSNLSIVNTDCKEMKLSWQGNYYSYIIYISSAGDFGKYKECAQSSTNSFTFIPQQYASNYLPPNEKYFFKVIGVDLNPQYTYVNGEIIYSNASSFSESISGMLTCALPTPTNLVVNSTNCSGVQLTWDPYPADPQTQLLIYRSESGEYGNYYKVASINATATTFFDTRANFPITVNQPVYYKIGASKSDFYSSSSNVATTTLACDLDGPSNLKVTQQCKSITLTWDGLAAGVNSQGYIVYRNFVKNGNYFTKVGNTAANITTFTDNYNFSGNIEYLGQIQYKIVGIINSASNIFSKESNTIETTLNCPIVLGLTATVNNCKSIQLQWTDISNIAENGYAIFESYDNKYFYEVGRVSTGVTSFLRTNTASSGLVGGSKIYYKVAGIFNNVVGGASTITEVIYNCTGPSNLTASSNQCGVISLTWDYPQNFYGQINYSLHRATLEQPNNFEEVKNFIITDNKIDDSNNIVSGQPYIYKLKTVYNYNLTKISDWSNLAGAMSNCNLPVPQSLLVDNTSCGKITLKWTATDSPDVSKFTIFRRKINSNEKFRVFDIDKQFSSFVDTTDIEAQQTYEYKVSSLKNPIPGYSPRTYSSFSNIVTASYACSEINTLHMANASCASITLAWSGPTELNVSSYEIWRSTNGANGNFVKITEIRNSGTSFMDNAQYYKDYQNFGFVENANLIAGQKYYYKIRARYNSLSNNTILGAYSNVAEAYFDCAGPENVSASDNTCNSVSLSWAAHPLQTVPNINYIIYRSDNGPNGFFSYLNQSKTNFFVDKTAILGVKYFYKIKTLIGSVLTDFSSTMSGAITTKQISKSSGYYTNPNIWSCGRVPTLFDDLQIGVGHTVELPNNTTGYAKTLQILGGITFGINSAINFNGN